MYNYDELMYFDKSSFCIIDIGLKYTKVGYGSECEPRRIIPTPAIFDYENFMKKDTEMQMNNIPKDLKDPKPEEKAKSENSIVNILAYKYSLKEIKLSIESFIFDIFYSVLQLKKQQREKNYNCILALDFSLESHLFDVYELIVKTILDNSLIQSVKIIPKQILPIFVTGFASGIVVDMGYIFTTITPINMGYPYMNKTEIISIGGVELERCLKRSITSDNLLIPKKKIKNAEIFNESVIPNLNDLMPRSAIFVNKSLSNLLKDPKEESKIKNDSDYSKIDFYKNVPDFNLSFMSRINLGEKMFGDYENNEINIAYCFMQVLMRLSNEERKKLCGNVVLSGGVSMLMGVQKRFSDEVECLFDAPEFKILQPLKNHFKLHKIIFPRNCITWIGASMLTNYERLNFKHLTLTKEEMDVTDVPGVSDAVNSLNVRVNPLKKIFTYFK